MLLEHRTVSRKTPRDGKLEISAGAARRLAAIQGDVQVVLERRRGTGALTSMTCTCRAGGEEHVHHFLTSDLFRSLRPERRVQLDLDAEAGMVLVTETDGA
ncbi:MAG TPA: hypothetical protein VMM18_08870 [Gemmatimonadaceae bacterium]|nr:hypothetical protein [Gemmatimonadaceae bacterium]